MKYLLFIVTIFFAFGCDFEPLDFKKANNYTIEDNKTEKLDSNSSSIDNKNETIDNNSTKKSDTQLKKDDNSTKESIEKSGSDSVSKSENNQTAENNKADIIKNKKEKILILDNDAYDPDYIPLVLGAMHENRWGYTKVGLMIVSDIGITGKTNMLYRSILDRFDSNISLAITHKHEGIVFGSKLTNNIENYTDVISDSDTEDAIIALQNKLEAKDDKTVSYATGGKLKFLRDFIADPYRLELFKLKVKEITFGLGCNPTDKNCERDYNLACTKEAYNATKTVYSKLHGKIPFNVAVFDTRRGDRKNLRSLDIFKTAGIDIMNHLLSTNIYGTYGDHHVGDIEILLVNSRKEHFKEYHCNVVLTKKSFKATSIGKAGIDRLYINKDIDLNGLTRAMYKSLIEHLDK